MKKYYYALPTRPPHGFFPAGYEYDIDGTVAWERDSFCRHGIVSYEFRLTDDMINDLEIVPFSDSDRIKNLVESLENHKYIDKYRELYHAGKDIRPEVSNIIRKKAGVRLHPSEINQIFDRIMEG